MIFDRNLNVAGREINDDSPVFIIAEAGVNHGGDISIAKKLIDIAANAGADAVKFQAFRTESLILQNIKKAPYQQLTTDSSESQFDMLKKLEVTKTQNIELKAYCKEKEIIFLTTPFDEYSLDELDDIDLPAYKIASTDTTNIPFLENIAQKGKPIFLSTGMSFLSEVGMALEAIHRYNDQVVLMQCTANYPIDDDEAHLNVIETYKNNFDVLVGYSDHSAGLGAALYSIPMGAKVVEKHFTISKEDEGPDHRASLDPDELKAFVKEVRKVEKYLGSYIKKPSLAETKTRSSLQKCLVANKNIIEGELFTKDNLIAKRTGGEGLSPIYYYELIGKRASKNYTTDEIIL